ncbi:ArsC family reductase [Sphingomonas koreensis]|nr:ArsC family reductase [Sphingomonas koreensis]
MTTIYGIKNCDTMKKARAWLMAQGVDHDFYDYKKEGVEAAQLAHWADRVGWEKLLNRAGTTFRKVPESDRANLDRDKAIALMVAQPSLIKRPVLEHGETLLVGFKPDAYAAAFAG